MAISYILTLYCLVILLCCIIFPFIDLPHKALRRTLKVLLFLILFSACNLRIQNTFKLEAYTPAYNPTVYVTDHGDHYHSRGCGSLWHSSYSKSLCEVTVEQYICCSKCNPPKYGDSERSRIISSRQSQIPELDEFLMSKQYLVCSVLVSLFIVCCFRFEWPEKASASNRPLLSKFLNYVSISFGAFFLPGVLLSFIFIYYTISIATLIFVPLSSLIKKTKKISPKRPVGENICSVKSVSTTPPPVQEVKLSRAQRVCEAIWSQLDNYVKNADPTLDKRKQLYLWGIYFYVVVKTVKDQRFINEVYSHFDIYAAKRIIDPEHRSYVVHSLREIYREIRTPLNRSGINPVTESGKQQLWHFTLDYLYEGILPPAGAHERFNNSVILLRTLSRFHYSKFKEESAFSIERFSISEPNNETELPIE